MTQFIDTREAALAEFKSDLRSARRRGVAIDPAYAAKARRMWGNSVLAVARSWKAQGEFERAAHSFRVARGHFIIARCYDRMQEKN